MLGDLVYEAQGKPVGMRVLPNGKIEQTTMEQVWSLERNTRLLTRVR
jgi:hypothetical protein